MREASKQDRKHKGIECPHTSDGAGDAICGQRAKKGSESSVRHRLTRVSVSRSDPQYMKLYYQRNKEKWRARRSKDKETRNKARRERYRDNIQHRDKCKEAAKKYRKEHPDVRRKAEIKTRYGISLADYHQLILRQNNACAICNNEFTKTPHVDHCHSGGHVRGLLCFNCNRALGHFQDSGEIMRSAIKYIEQEVLFKEVGHGSIR